MMPGSLAKILSTVLLVEHDRAAMERSMKHHQGWLAVFLDEVGPYVVADMIELLCLDLDICRQKLEIERKKNVDK